MYREKNNLYEYLHSNSINPYIIELLEYVINHRVYHFGNNYINSWENQNLKKNRIKNFLILLYKKIKSKTFKSSTNLILSNAYFTVNDEIENNGFKIVIPWWAFKKTGFYLKDNKFVDLFEKIHNIIRHGGVNNLININTINIIIEFKKEAKSLIKSNNFKAAIFSNDLDFFERLFIDVFKELNIPTFIFLHGLPGRYNNIDDNRADYLIVWGNKIKENYIKAGVDSKKIIVTGHPYYNNLKIKKPQFNLRNILVISKTMNGTPSISDNIILSDRGNCLLYLEIVKKNLNFIWY